MAILKLVDLRDNRYGSNHPDLIGNEITYILNPFKMPNQYWGGAGFVSGNLESIIMQFSVPRKIFRKEGCIPARHFILDFEYSIDRVTPLQAYYIAEEVCGLFSQSHQILYGVHELPKTHIHFLVNAVDMYTGKMLNLGYKQFDYYKWQIQNVLNDHYSWCGSGPVRINEAIYFGKKPNIQ